MEKKQPYKETLTTLSTLAKDTRLSSAEQTALMLAYGYIYYHESLYHKLSEREKAEQTILPQH